MYNSFPTNYQFCECFHPFEDEQPVSSISCENHFMVLYLLCTDQEFVHMGVYVENAFLKRKLIKCTCKIPSKIETMNRNDFTCRIEECIELLLACPCMVGSSRNTNSCH